MGQNRIDLQLPSGGRITFSLTDEALALSTGHKVKLSVPYRQVINATFNPTDKWLEIAYLARNKHTKKYYLFRYNGSVDDTPEESVSQWIEMLMHTAYEGVGVKRSRRLRVLVNPYGGLGKGPIIFSRKIEPIFRAAGCIIDVTKTTHSGHAYEIAKELLVDDYDVLVTVSGDGLIHEVMNGFANHSNPRKAFSLSIAPIPSGSGNALSVNLLGPRDGFDVAVAALNVIKGLPMRVDAFSVIQNNRRMISFMSQAVGLMADADLGTEHLRWLGDTRFFVGFICGVILQKPCPVRLSYKAVETDKAKMVETLKSRRADGPRCAITEPDSWPDTDTGLPPLQEALEDEEGWTTIEEPLLYVYAGKGPFVSRDYMPFPVSLPDDGLIDIAVMPISSPSKLLQALSGAANGESFWHKKLRYVKARAYRIRPYKRNGNLSVDGEAMPFEDFQVEVHAKLATVLSLYGHYVADFPRK